mgnify:CR=1 FL=1
MWRGLREPGVGQSVRFPWHCNLRRFWEAGLRGGGGAGGAIESRGGFWGAEQFKGRVLQKLSTGLPAVLLGERVRFEGRQVFLDGELKGGWSSFNSGKRIRSIRNKD